jgi:DNA-binding MarR family transcriptional regulator
MQNENFITIQGWMINELKLKGNELILYAIIYGFSQDGKSEYYGSQRYIAKAVGISLPNVNKLINKLLEKELIIKTSESHYKVFKKVNASVQKSEHQAFKKVNTSVQKSEQINNNLIINNNNNNNNAKTSFAVSPITEIIKEDDKNIVIGLLKEVGIDTNIDIQEKEFNYKNKIIKMARDKNKHIQIIAMYWFYKKFVYENKEQYQSAIRRELRPAQNLIGYTLERIRETMFFLNGTSIFWTLETVHKFIDKDLQELREKGGLFFGGDEQIKKNNY